ncbi:hypothetical protein FBQ96_11025 [Nitrospirales bacterium NOB]|nr:hypothetical protein [Nitrospirota bacterium]MCE7963892.1 hypothetical protein [Nitrospira sp. NTP2]MDL1890093.1 hypothetical protein [Nitrospirales bacterium NOB]MEB2339257.1 hypothetical protein [Nitrospirales bacterium]QOJ35564.1 MAG: hypothetical protein HRU82_11700 [Nitrospira sp.]
MNRSLVALACLCLLLLTLSACGGRGLNRQLLQQAFHDHPDVVTNQDIAATLALQPQLTTPYRLAVYFKPREFPTTPSLRRADWVSADADRLIRALAPVTEEGIVRESFVLADSTVQGTTFRDLRLAAARYHADALLVIDGASAVERYNNGHAAWYATGVGLYLAHGTESHALFMMEGTLWDVRTGYLYGTQTAEGETTLIGPAPSLEDRDAIAEAKDVALERFGREVAEMVRLVREKQRAAD